MKQLISFLIIGFISTGLFAQKISSSQVPLSILKDFNSKFSTAKKVKWVKEEKNYEVEFILNGKGIDVTYDTIGNWVETLSEIALVELPATVIDSINRLFQNCTITSAARIDQISSEALYEAEIKFNGKRSVATFDSNGNQVD
jgi:hypothetical protein